MVTFSKGQASEVVANGGLKVMFKDLILDVDTELDCDLVVLATGQVPNVGPDPYAQLAVEETEDEEEKAKAQALLENAPPSILNLDYRQGTDLPQLKHGFVDSHFICFPYETHRTGIYAAGPVRRPMDMKQAVEGAAGAAMKAIQAVENAGQGRAAHPRVGDLSYPTFRKEGCIQCKRCTVECPFGAINEDEQKYPMFNESRCRRCGTCMGACPVRVISFENYSIDTVGQQLKNVEIPDEFEEKPRILALACENDAYPALDMARPGRQRGGRAGAYSLGAGDSGALPGLGEPVLGYGRPQQRLRRYRAHGLPSRRRLPMPLRARIGHGRRAHKQGRRYALLPQPGARTGRRLRGRHHRHQARAPADQ